MRKSVKSVQSKSVQGKTTRLTRIRGASSQRRERQKQELRQRILDAAGKEFLEHGYENFSLRRVAECIGYSATTIYLYFQDKDDLLLSTVQEGFKHFDRQMVAAANQTTDPLQRIESLGRAYIQFGLQNTALYRLMFMQRSDFYFMPRFDDVPSVLTEAANQPTPETVSQAPIQERPMAQTLLVTAVREAMEQNLLCAGDPTLTADMLWAGAHGLVSLVNSPLMTPEYAQGVIDLLLATLINGLKPH